MLAFSAQPFEMWDGWTDGRSMGCDENNPCCTPKNNFRWKKKGEDLQHIIGVLRLRPLFLLFESVAPLDGVHSKRAT